MPHRNYLPEHMGEVALDPGGPFEAGSHVSLTLTYTAGKFGMDDNGSLKFGFRTTNDAGQPQFDDPEGANFTTVEASNGAALECRYEHWRNIRPWGRSTFVRVSRGFLREGDRIVVRLGDRRQGSPGFRIQSFCEYASPIRVFVDAFATYDYTELPCHPTFQVLPGQPAAWKAVLPTLRRPGDPFRLGIKCEDRWGNPSDKVNSTLTLHPSMVVDGLPERVALRPGQLVAVLDGLQVDREGDLVVELRDESGEPVTTTNPLRVRADAPLLHYWGDLHHQTNETVGTNTAREMFIFARDRAFLDVASHQANDFQVTGEFWAELNALTAEFDESGRFVAIPGYEWSGNTGVGGDHNVWYRHEGRPIYRSSHALVDDLSDVGNDCHTATDLFEALRDEDVVVASHCGGRYADISIAHDTRLAPSVEIHSAWGTFEWILADALELEYRTGIIANSDGHKGRPGASYPGASKFGSYGGLTCFLAPELTREAIFDAMRRRHHVATTGARIIVDTRVRLNAAGEIFERDPEAGPSESHIAREAIMGDIVRVTDTEVTFVAEVVGSASIERLEVRDGLEVLETVRPYAAEELGSRIRVVWEGANYRGRGRQVTWDGDATVEGNSVTRLRPLNFWNPEQTVALVNEHTLSWTSVTTGSFSGFDAWLRDRDAGRLVVSTPLVQCEIPIAGIGLEDTVFDAGGLGRRLRACRLPDENSATSLRLERTLPVRPTGDTRLYVCVTQEDGHRAWSSPIYLFR